MLRRQFAMLAIALLALATLGAAGDVLAPDWQPEPVDQRLAYPPLPAAPPAERGEPADEFAVQRDEVRIAVDGQTLTGIVHAPISTGRHPAIVFVHGGGTGRLDTYAGQAERLARAGIVTLTYDKRTVGYSITHRDYRQLAGDALAAVALLRGRADVDPDLVGLWGISEGGWVVPLAASAPGSPVAFAILVAAPATSPLRQSSWALDGGLRRLDAPDVARQAAVRAFASGGFAYADHDAMPALRALTVPVLAIYGTDDRAVPPVESARLLTAALAGAGNDRYAVRFFAGADHGLRVGGRLAPGYLATIASWVLGLPGTASGHGERVAGATPTQEYLSTSPAAPAYGGPAGLLAGWVLILGGYLAAPVTSLVGRLRGRPRVPATRPRLRRRLRVLMACGLASVLVCSVFLGMAVTLALAAPDAAGARVAVTGGWLVARALAVLTAVLLVSTVAIAVSAYRGGWRARGVERVRLVSVCGGTVVALFLGAYWGLFAAQW